jgi:phospholipid N-methyltransferase
MADSMRNKSFFKTYLEQKNQVGSWFPSWPLLVNNMCRKIDFETADVIVEYGPGNGVFTKKLLKLAKPNTKLIVFELNEDFYNILKHKFNDPRMILLNQGAETLPEVLKLHNIKEVDAILSSLPLAMIPEEIKTTILDNSHNSLKKSGVFLQYQYSLNAKKDIEKRYGKLKVNLIPLNVPPAFVYKGVKS